MNIPVEYKDSKGVISTKNYKLTRLGFIKHLAIAGQGYAPKSQNLLRTIGMLLHYSYYIERTAFNNNRFSTPPLILSDPTEQGQFSTLAGKAIADFLSKKIDKSIFTTNYEGIASRPLIGQRPDLVAFTKNQQFTLEAKGRNQSNPGNMTEHKKQASSGNYPRHFSVACVSYNLFSQVTCNYHDPLNENIPYDNVGLQKVTKKYYSGLATFLNQRYFDFQEFNFQGETFYEVELSYQTFEKLFMDDFAFRPIRIHEIIDFYRPSLILPKEIMELAEVGLTIDSDPFIFESEEQSDNIYIDNDRIGLLYRR